MTGIETIQGSFRFTNNLVPLALSDLSDENAIARSRGGEGPSVAWTVGHMLHYRYLTMKLLGADKNNPYEKGFGEQGASDGTDYPSISDLRAQWAQVHEELEGVFASATNDVLGRSAPGPGGHGEQKVVDSLTFFMWHEAYHMGAITAVRKELGLPGIADLVMAQMKK